MDRKNAIYLWLGAAVFAAFAVFLLAPLVGNFFIDSIALSPTERAIDRKLAKEGESFKSLKFDLVDPMESPAEMHDLVVSGYHIMVETTQYANGYTGDILNCTHCHFAAGNTVGGKNGGISLAGVAAKYPCYDPRVKKVVDLPTRINYCFEKSMNGKALPLDGSTMLALVTYLHWISHYFPIYEKVPWLGLKPLKGSSPADPEKGAKVYATYCAMCHGANGEGQRYQGDRPADVPPLWGPQSFNEAAGMNEQKTLESFVYENMPYEGGGITREQARDVAAYIISQPHPKR